MRISCANGDVIIRADQCDCGSAGGCDKCRPTFILKMDGRLEPITPFLFDLTSQGLRDIAEGRYSPKRSKLNRMRASIREK